MDPTTLKLTATGLPLLILWALPFETNSYPRRRQTRITLEATAAALLFLYSIWS